jgi:3-oxoacyl-[acyl-carrier protein] reductase
VKFADEVKSIQFDAVVCNAGMFSENDDFNDFDLEDFTKTMNCNFYTPLIITTALKDSIVKGGSIVIVSSNDAYPGAFSSMSYSISKSALLSLMKCLSVNYGSRGIRVNTVAPGAIDTAMNTPEQMEISPYFSPIARVGTPEDVAKVVYFLSTEEAGSISGENITIDGGYSIESVLLKSEADPNLSVLLRTYLADPKFIKVVNEYADKIGVGRNNED